MKNRVIFFLCISLAITGIAWRQPYFVWGNNIIFRTAILLSLLFFIIYTVTTNFKIKKNDLYITIGLVISLIYFSLPGIEGRLGFTFGLISMIIFMIIPDYLKYKVFYYFSWIFAVSLLPGIIYMALSLLGFDFNYNIIQSDSGRYYKQYFGAVSILNSSNATGFTRLYAMYDEPGVVGTFAALILIADKFRIKNNLRNIIILIGGILSLSFAFMVMLIIYLVMRMNMKYIIVTVLLILLGNVLIPFDSEIMNRYVFDRFSIEDGRLEGDNRITTVSTQEELAAFYTSELRYLVAGMGNSAQSDNSKMFGDSWQFFIYNHGLLGLFILIFGTIIYVLYKVKYNMIHSIILVLIFFLSFYQRHEIINLYYMIVLFGGLANLQYKKRRINK